MDKDLSVDTRKHAHTHTLWLILSPLFMLHPVYWGLFCKRFSDWALFVDLTLKNYFIIYGNLWSADIIKKHHKRSICKNGKFPVESGFILLYCAGLLGSQRESPPKNENAVIGSLIPTCHSNPVWFLYLHWSFSFNAAQKKLKSGFQKQG